MEWQIFSTERVVTVVGVCVWGGGGGGTQTQLPGIEFFSNSTWQYSSLWRVMLTQKHKTDKAVWPTEGKLQTTPFLFRSRKTNKKSNQYWRHKNTPHNFRKGRPCPQRTASRCRKQNTATPGSTADSLKAGSFAVCPGSYKGENNNKKIASTTAVPTARLSVKAKLTLQASLSGTLPPLGRKDVVNR